MSCKVKIVKSVADIIRQLPQATRKVVRQRLLVDLPADHDLLGDPVFPYAHVRPFSVACPDYPSWWLVFRVDTGTPHELHVLDVQEVQGPDPDPNWTEQDGEPELGNSGPVAY